MLACRATRWMVPQSPGRHRTRARGTGVIPNVQIQRVPSAAIQFLRELENNDDRDRFKVKPRPL